LSGQQCGELGRFSAERLVHPAKVTGEQCIIAISQSSHNLLVQTILKVDAPSGTPEPVLLCPQVFFYTHRKGWDLSTTSAEQYNNTIGEDAHLLGEADPSGVSIHQQQVVPLLPASWDHPTSQKSHWQTDEAPSRRQ
jgi:hypothetical protein